jgi:hypothetical protein
MGSFGGDMEEFDTTKYCFRLFDNCIREVIVRMRQYQGSLLSACIHFVLSVPKQFVRVAELLPALEAALKLGLRFEFEF